MASGAAEALLSNLGSFHDVFVVIHLVGFALGVGAATVLDLSIAKFLSKIGRSNWSHDLVSTCSQIIWGALALIVVSGVCLYLPDAMRLNSSDKFMAKMIVVAVLIANGTAFHLLLAPRLSQLFREGSGVERRWRRLLFASGAVSATSWYSAVVLGGVPIIDLSLATLLLLYSVFILLAVGAALAVERIFSRRLKSHGTSLLRTVARTVLDEMDAERAPLVIPPPARAGVIAGQGRSGWLRTIDGKLEATSTLDA